MTEKILIAGTTQSQEDILSQNLRALGSEILTAHDATQTVTLSRQHVPGLVVLNAHQARWTVAALRSIRSSVHTAHIPVLALLSQGSQSEEEFTTAGAQVCVHWPMTDVGLYGAARRCLEIALNVTQAPGSIINDKERMADLEETEWLDSPPSERFDRLTRLASRLIGVPTSLVSLVDQNRQFFKSQIGLPQPWSSQRQTGLSHSFCQWVVSSGEPLMVDDARQHPVLKNNSAVTDIGVVAYAGVPLYGRRNQPIGSFCVIDGQPHDWSPVEMELLQDLAAALKAMAVSNASSKIAGVPEDWPPNWIKVIGNSLHGATRILRRYAERIQAQDKKDLLDLIDEQTSLLLNPRTTS